MSMLKRVNVTKALEPTPFCVEWAAARDSEHWDLAYFSSSVEAHSFAVGKAGLSQCVWQREIGAYDDADNQTTRTWLYHWWNAFAEDSPLPEKGKGYLLYGEEPIAYRPLNAER